MITGAANGSKFQNDADPLYQHLIITAERNSGAVSRPASPLLFGAEPPKPRIEAVRIVDMSFFECLGRVRGGLLAD